VTTLPTIPRHEILELGGVVTAQVVVGQGSFVEFVTDIRNRLGLRGSELEARWNDVKDEAFLQLRRNAALLGCNAVVGVDMGVTALAGPAGATGSLRQQPR